MAASMMNTETVIEPPYCSLKIVIDDAMKEKLLGVKRSLSYTQSGEQFHKMLLAESRLLHISIYKRSAQLRREKSIQLLRRVKACLQRLHHVNRLFTLSNDVIKDIDSSMNTEESEAFLPSHQVWTYLLHLTSSYFSLLERTMEYSVAAFEHLSSQFATGMLIPTMVLYMGIMSRIWQLCRSLQVRLATLYATVYTFHWEMKPTISNWVYPPIPSELSNPLAKTFSQADDWLDAKLDLESKEQGISEKGMTVDLNAVDIGIPVRSTCDDLEDLGVTVFSKKRKGWRTDDNVFPSKKRKIKQNTTVLQERPKNKTAKFCPAAEMNPEDHSLKKKKKKKKKNAGTVKMSQVSEQGLDESHDKIDKIKLSTKNKSLKKNKTKLKKMTLSDFESVSDKTFPKDQQSPKFKRKSVPPSKMKKKKANNDNERGKKQKIHKVSKDRHEKTTATNDAMANKDGKKKKKGKVKNAVTGFLSSNKKIPQRIDKNMKMKRK